MQGQNTNFVTVTNHFAHSTAQAMDAHYRLSQAHSPHAYQMSGNTPTYQFFLTDHLGSVRVVADENGSVRQVNQYYPYGDLIEDANMIEWMSDNRYRFTGKELVTETGLYDFCARYLETSMGRFTTIDPFAEKCPSVSPYVYCAGDPVNRVDPTGMTDYFSLAGLYIGSDDNDNGEIRIFTPQNGSLKFTDYTDMETLHDYDSVLFSQAVKFSDQFSEDAALNVYKHYNTTGLPLELDKSGTRSMGFVNAAKPFILVNIHHNAMMDNYYNLQSRLNIHEGEHYEQWQSNNNASTSNKYVKEILAVATQMFHDSWSKTTEDFREDAIYYMFRALSYLIDENIEE